MNDIPQDEKDINDAMAAAILEELDMHYWAQANEDERNRYRAAAKAALEAYNKTGWFCFTSNKVNHG